MADEKVPFYKTGKFVITLVVIGTATALLVFGVIAVDVYERLMLGAIGASS